MDSAAVTELIDEFIANYNNLIGNIGYQSRIGNPLNGDASMRSLQSQLNAVLSTTIAGVAPFETVFDIGLGLDKDGYLEMNSLVRSLNDALESNYDEVGELFAGVNGLAASFQSLIDNYIESDGLIGLREDTLNGQLDDLEDDVVNHEYRMEQLEVRLRQQYSSLDVLIAQMQSTQTYLSAQLANLPGFGGSKS